MSIDLPAKSSPPAGLNRGWGVGHAGWKVAGVHVSIAGACREERESCRKRESQMKQIVRSLFVVLPVE